MDGKTMGNKEVREGETIGVEGPRGSAGLV